MKKLMTVLAAAMSAAVFAVDFPAPDPDGTVTLTTAGTYGAAIPSGTLKLVVNANGEVTLSAASTGFTGPVEILSGSKLIVTHKDAVSKASSITVKSGGTFLPNFTSPGQTTLIFSMPIYIAGTGTDGNGAFEFLSPASDAPDTAVSQLILTADATINCSKRWGVRGDRTIDLQGHTLTRKGSGNLMIVSANVTSGNFINTSGTLTFQSGGREFGPAVDAANTVFTIKGGAVTFWDCNVAVPYKMVFDGGGLSVGAGAGVPPYNTFSGPVTLKTAITLSCDASKSAGFMGPIELQKGLTLNGAGTLYLGGTINANGIQQIAVTGSGKIVMNSADVGNPAPVMRGGSFEIDCSSGTLEQLRIANASSWGVLHHVNGKLGFNSGDNPRVGEATGSFGAYVFENGAMYPSNTFYLAVDQTDSHGVFLQKGGLFELRKAGYFRAGNANTEAVFVQTGGTNDTRLATNQSANFRLGEGGGSNYSFAVTGSNTLFETDAFYWGSASAATKAVIALNDGATFKANRFKTPASRPTSDVTLCLNGGIMCPTLAYGWNGENPWGGDGNFRKTVPEHVVVFAGGVTFDSSAESLAANTEVPFALKAPEGQGIKSISFPTDSGFSAAAYKGPVPVRIEGPSGSYGAAAYADYDFKNKQLSKIIVTSSGCNYDSTTKIYLQNPTRSAQFLCPTFELTGTQVGGGLTHRGSHGIKIWGECSYTGGTTVESGTLTMNYGVPNDAPLKVLKGATLDSSGRQIRVTRLSGQGTVLASGVTVTESLDIDATAFAAGATPLSANATFAEGAKVNLTLDAQQMAGLNDLGLVEVLKSSAVIGVTPPQLLVNGQKDDRWCLRLSADKKTLKAGPRRGLFLVVR